MVSAKTQLAVFDWDGTIVDSVGRILGCFRAAAEDLSATPPSQSVLKGAIGLGLPETARHLFPDRDEVFWDRFADAYRSRWLAPEAPIATLFDGARATVLTLRQRGFRLAVATGKSRRGLDRELGETGLEGLFEVTRCADETRSKPHPQMLREVLAAAGVRASSAVMIGDSSHDLRMARAASVPSIAACYGVQTSDELRALGPVHCIDGIEELVGLLCPDPRAPTARLV